MSKSLRAGGALLTASFMAVVAACATEGNAQTSSSSSRMIPDDTAAVSRLLGAVRGAAPLYCELVTRQVDQRGSWSHWGSMSSESLVTDTASAAMLVWIQRKHNDPVVVPRLRAALRDSDACVRRIAGSFLGRVDHPSALSALLSALEDSNAETRVVSAIGLGMSEETTAVDPLISRLKDSAPLVRRAAAWALGALEAKKAVAPLMALLTNDNDPRVRQTAAWAIGTIKH
jgi:HEAT repeat protein